VKDSSFQRKRLQL